MATATAGGIARAGGWRRSCRRLLPVLLSLGLFVPVPVAAAAPSDAWTSARALHAERAVAIGLAARSIGDAGGDADDIIRLRGMVASAVVALDALEVHDCFRVWWSYVRSSYVMFDVALVGLQGGDAAAARSATASSMLLARLASGTDVQCAGDGRGTSVEASRGPMMPLA